VNKITLNFISEEEDFIQSLLDYSPPRQIMLSVFRGLMFFPVIFILGSLLVNVFYGDIKEAASFIFPSIFMAIIIFYPYSSNWIKRKMIHPDLFSQTIFEFDEDNFLITKQNINSKIPLASLSKVYENDKYYFLIYNAGTNFLQRMFFALPKRAIQSDEQHISLRSLFEQKIGKIENLQNKLTSLKLQLLVTILTIFSIAFCAFLFLRNYF
jgi:hypothetical protein